MEKKSKHAGGRPSLYTPELAKRICELVASNPYGIRKICQMYPELPDETTIHHWRAENTQFFLDYVQARQKQAHLLFECAIDELEELNDYVYESHITGAKEINAGIVAMKKAIANQKSRQAAILYKNYQLNKDDNNDDATKAETLTKIRSLVNDLNKTNTSDI
jgi:hypothetical protein